ncbi:hypothetical protein SBRY_150018 [Actinacidiphila bryophytorum]|uniref:Uncharacterized protein n=1 Tax=Actinacidiphila bryophytorum TaxID=1436133 RepID=A0A9W4GXQ3_9ACTN|nr:hypothetical protein SBRY_150018 [Actinacidiphila bryophytorum]
MDDHPDHADPELLQDPRLHRLADPLEDPGRHLLTPVLRHRTAVRCRRTQGPRAQRLSGGCAAAS